ncbi:MAG: acyltransferase [Candidatus ainarchaeum sp.]|nr:acyltransferase [Candidatus ainarchaeum sp.]
MRDLTILKTFSGESSNAWKTKKSSLIIFKNWFCAWIASRLPGKAKLFFYKKMGVRIGKNVQIMPDVRMEIFFPEEIEIGDNVVIGQETFISAHEFNVHEFRYGKIIIGNNVLIGARSFLLPGIVIGNNSIIPANTTIYKNVPKNSIAFGSPLQFKEFKIKKNK